MHETDNAWNEKQQDRIIYLNRDTFNDYKILLLLLLIKRVLGIHILTLHYLYKRLLYSCIVEELSWFMNMLFNLNNMFSQVTM